MPKPKAKPPAKKAKLPPKRAKTPAGEEGIRRVRRICMALPETTEKPSHGEPTFFMRKRVFCMFANNHHNDGHIAVWTPAEPGVQAALIQDAPRTYFRPPYVGPAGWVGIELAQVSDEGLAAHLLDAWRLMEAKQKPRRAKPRSKGLSF